jgi:hypothetical protein
MLYAVGCEDWAQDKKFKLTPEQYERLEHEAKMIMFEIKLEHPDVTPEPFSMETTLCAFKKIFRERDGRYLGYYLDRQAEDIIKCQNDGWEGIDWDLLWQGRKEHIAEYLLNNQVDKSRFGELARTNTIQYLYDTKVN